MRRSLLALAVVLVTLGLLAPAAGATAPAGEEDNRAVAVNTEDGASLFRMAFSVVRVTDGAVDQTNIAAALASCTDCTTVALAFQVVLVEGDADVVTPENKAYAVNSACVECITYASATQLVLSVDGPVRLTGEGMRRLVAVLKDLRDLERNIDDTGLAELNARVQAAKQELVDVFTQELVPIGRPDRPGDGPTTTTTSTSTPSTSTTTTTSGPEDDGSTTTTSEAPSTSTTSTTAPTTTTSAVG